MHIDFTSLRASWHATLLILLTTSLIAMPDVALATAVSDVNPMSDVFCIATTWITGPVAKAISILTLSIVGIGAMLGKMSWGLAMLVGTNVAVVFGAAAIVDALAAGSAFTASCNAIIGHGGGGPPLR